jgi:hypothetical protein
LENRSFGSITLRSKSRDLLKLEGLTKHSDVSISYEGEKHCNLEYRRFGNRKNPTVSSKEITDPKSGWLLEGSAHIVVLPDSSADIMRLLNPRSREKHKAVNVNFSIYKYMINPPETSRA